MTGRPPQPTSLDLWWFQPGHQLVPRRGLAPTTLSAASPNADFITELLYNRVYSLMWTQGTRWVDARRYNRLGTLPLDRSGDVVHPNMLIPSAECDARGLDVPCSMSGG